MCLTLVVGNVGVNTVWQIFLIFFITKPLWARVLTQHCADLIGQDGVCVVQPAASAQALFEAVEDGLVGEKHHQDPQGCCDRA